MVRGRIGAAHCALSQTLGRCTRATGSHHATGPRLTSALSLALGAARAPQACIMPQPGGSAADRGGGLWGESTFDTPAVLTHANVTVLNLGPQSFWGEKARQRKVFWGDI